MKKLSSFYKVENVNKEVCMRIVQCILRKLTADLESIRPRLKKWLASQDKTKDATPEELDRFINLANQFDPTGREASYTWWIMQRMLDENIRLPEDGERVRRILDRFHQAKRRREFTGEKDVSKYKTIQQVEDALPQMPTQETGGGWWLKTEEGKQEIVSGLRKIDEEPPYILYEITTPEAAVYVSTGYVGEPPNAQSVDWCTKTYERAVEYLSAGVPLYMITRRDLGNEKGKLWEGVRYILTDEASGYFNDIRDAEASDKVYGQVRDLLLRNNITIPTKELKWMANKSKGEFTKDDLERATLYSLKYLLIILSREYGISRFAERAWDTWKEQHMESAGRRIFVLNPLDLPTTIDFEPVDVQHAWEQAKRRASGYSVPIEENETLKQAVQYVGEAYNAGIKRTLEQRLEKLRRTLNDAYEAAKRQLVKQKGFSSFDEMSEEESKDIIRQSKIAAANKFSDLFKKVYSNDNVTNAVDTRKIMEGIVNGLKEKFSIALKS